MLLFERWQINFRFHCQTMNAETQKSFTYLKEVEEVAQEILTDKQAKLELSNAQNKYREAYRALQSVEERQTWLKLGSVYVRLPREDCREILKKGKTLYKVPQATTIINSSYLQMIGLLNSIFVPF